MRYAIAVVAACALTVAPRPHAAGRPDAPAPRAAQTAPANRTLVEKSLVEKYCAGCHNARTRTADLDLASLDIENAPAHAEIWEKVVRKLRTGAMPPAGMPRPDEAAYDALASSLERALDAVPSRHAGTPALRRLNRTEYANAVRDLLGLEVDAATLLPPDDISGGFDNNAGALGVSPALLERYLSAAAKIGALAVGDPALLGPSAQTYVVRGDASQTAHVEGLPLGTRGGVVARHTFPLDGQYVLKASLLQTNLGAVRGLLEPHDIEFSIDGRRVFLATVGGNEDNARGAANTGDMIAALDTRLTTRVTVTAGPHVVGASFLSRTGAQGGSKLQPFLRTTLDAGDHSGLPHVASLTITGPFDATGPGDTPSRQRIFSCRPRGPADESRCARTILSALAYHGYRRPVTSAEIDRLLTLYRAGRQQGSFDTGIEFGLRAILANPKFVFRTEGRSPESSIDDYDLASRLSFFLWSSIPDDELLVLAGKRQLHTGRHAGAAGAPHAGRSPGGGAREQLRRPVAAAHARGAAGRRRRHARAARRGRRHLEEAEGRDVGPDAGGRRGMAHGGNHPRRQRLRPGERHAGGRTALPGTGANVNEADANGVTPLHDAVVRGPAVMKLLIDHGATLDVKDKRDRTPLDVAQGVRAPGEAQRMKTSPLREASAAFLRQSSGAGNAASGPR